MSRSIASVQAENGLWDLLWQVAVDEAYAAKDAPRRMEELQGLTQRQVVEVYFSYNHAMKTWAADHVAEGTCEAAIRDLQVKWDEAKAKRAAQRVAMEEARRGVLTDPVREDAPDWMKPFMSGPAHIPPVDWGETREQPRPPPKPEQEEVNAWLLTRAQQEGKRLKQTDQEIRLECREATGATYDQITTAFRNLPEQWRYNRGKPPTP